METSLIRGLSKPSSYLVALFFISSILTSCSWNSTDQELAQEDVPGAQSVESGSDNIATVEDVEITEQFSTPVIESTETEAVEASLTEPARTVPAEPELELSYYGVPAPKEDLSIFDLCQEIGNKLGSVSVDDCLDQKFNSDGGQSVLGRPLAIKEFPELSSRKPLGRVLLVGGIHGDEFSAVSIVFKWMQILEAHHSGIFHWRFVPVSNPDGLLAEDSTRLNQNGVDLNRNFPSDDWDELAIPYWRERTNSNSRRFPGSSAGSEPEVEWLVNQIDEFQPDVVISVHAPYHLVDYDGPPEAPQRLGDLQLSKLGVYPGSLGNYAGVDLEMPVVTIELPYAGILPSEDQISMMWTDLVAWLVSEQSRVADAN